MVRESLANSKGHGERSPGIATGRQGTAGSWPQKKSPAVKLAILSQTLAL
jgi:hypothetical protein